ncbi:NAD(P)-dependent oxidoreductase [Gordonia sp. LSe1-13]|uniref:NAD(P)-dependent oxidoreductase n=1 Tax=Gordonia sesuvii TaxID=3116777 RepID=A0ABU7MIU0_9ACTN|nr:NAD(P)-dependent oxidoreductase [Gordonia sp. LSe1-13]
MADREEFDPPAGRNAETVSFIGLGVMGSGIARNLMKGGVDLTVYDVRRDVVESFAAEGARAASSPADLAHSSLVFVSVPGPPQFEEVLFGENGLADLLDSGTLIVDLTTNRPSTVQAAAAKLADRGIALVDAPVSGGRAGAEQGTLSIPVGGSADDFHRAQPYLALFSSKLLHAGDLGAGDACKLIHNLGLNIQRQALAEMFTLAVKSGIEPQLMHDFVSAGSFGRNDFLQWLPPRVFTREFEKADPPWYRHELSNKDTRLAMDIARDLDVPAPLGSVCLDLSEQVLERGWGDRDSWVVFTLQEEAAGVVITSRPDGEAARETAP